jgi:glucan biosynthesis protein C
MDAAATDTLAEISLDENVARILDGGPLVGGPPSRPPSFTPGDFPLTHLWFLWELSLILWTVCGLRLVLDRFGQLSAVSHIVEACTVAAVRGSFGLLAAIPLAATLAVDPRWLPWFGVGTPDQQLYPSTSTLTGYWLAFATGWVIWRRPDLLQTLRERSPWHLASAAAATIACLAIIGVRPSLVTNGPPGAWVGYAMLYAVASWQWTLGLVGAFQRWLSQPNRAIRYLSDASYWLYIAHLPLMLFLQALMVHVALPWPIKLVLVLATTLGALTLGT